MKFLQSSFILFLLFTACQPETLNEKIISSEGEEILVGRLTPEAFNDEPFNEWYSYYFEFQETDTEILDEIAAELKKVEIKVFLGTWCSDSQEQIPGLIRMLKYIGYTMENLTLIGLEKAENGALVSPGQIEKGFNITHVPTYIFYRDSQEIGRIVEYPEVSLEMDMKKIVLTQ